MVVPVAGSTKIIAKKETWQNGATALEWTEVELKSRARLGEWVYERNRWWKLAILYSAEAYDVYALSAEYPGV